MKYTFDKFLRKTALIHFICLLLLLTTSCSSTQTDSTQAETIKTPSEVTNSPQTTITATPSPVKNSPEAKITESPTTKTDNKTDNKLSTTIKSAVLSDASKRISKSIASLRIIEAEKQSWGDSCLGLAAADKICAQVIVPGWKVVVTDGQNKLVYRTDDKGKQVILED